jgi:glutamine synthetase
MPKPVKGDNGSGMHCHQSIWKGGKPLFAGSGYADLSDTALYYIGGIIKHAKALNAFTNPTTNSYKRLIPGFEAPVLLAYSSRNRSASCRIPYVASPKGKRVEVRFPDPSANPYLAYAAMLMAGLDGIENKIHPGDPMDKNLYDLPPEELKDVPTVCGSLRESIAHLEADSAFLKKGDVFSNDLLDSHRAEVRRSRLRAPRIRWSPSGLQRVCVRSDDKARRIARRAFVWRRGNADPAWFQEVTYLAMACGCRWERTCRP